MSKIPVYFMPGLAASSTIFERIKLDDSVFEMCLLEWEIPQTKESLSDYALRITKNIKHENPDHPSYCAGYTIFFRAT